MDFKEYKENNCLICPYCRSKNVDINESGMDTFDEAGRELSYNDCFKEWIDILTVTSFVLTQEDNNEKSQQFFDKGGKQ